MADGVPEFKTSALLAEILSVLRSGNRLSSGEARRYELDAEALLKIDGAECDGYTILSALAAVAWDVQEARRYAQAAIETDGDVGDYYNAALTMSYLNRPDLADEFSSKVEDCVPIEQLWWRIIVTKLSLGQLSAAAAFYRSGVEAQLEETMQQPDPANVRDAACALGLTEERIGRELRCAFDVLTESKLRTSAVVALPACDEHAKVDSVVFQICYFSSATEEEVDELTSTLDRALVTRLMGFDDWDPRVFAIEFSGFNPDADPSH